MERRGNTYEEFAKIISAEGNYSPEKILLLEVAANRMFEELDNEIAENLAHSESKKVFDQEEDIFGIWDFPDPPHNSWQA